MTIYLGVHPFHEITLFIYTLLGVLRALINE